MKSKKDFYLSVERCPSCKSSNLSEGIHIGKPVSNIERADVIHEKIVYKCKKCEGTITLNRTCTQDVVSMKKKKKVKK